MKSRTVISAIVVIIILFLARSIYSDHNSKKFIKDEEFAKANKLGMWATTFQYPWDFRKAS